MVDRPDNCPEWFSLAAEKGGGDLVPPQLLWVLLFSVSIALSSARMAPSAPPLLLLSLIEHLPRVCHPCSHCGFSLFLLCWCTFVMTIETSVNLPSRKGGAFLLLFWREDLSPFSAFNCFLSYPISCSCQTGFTITSPAHCPLLVSF